MTRSPSLSSLPDDELLARLQSLVSRSCRLEAQIVAHIAEVDARQLYLGQACSSMFVYCTERLHLSEHAAYRRIEVARAVRRFPQFPWMLAMLADGRLHLTGAARLARHLTADNCEPVLARAAHQTSRAIDELIAELARRAPTGLTSVAKSRICVALRRCASVEGALPTPSARLALLAASRFCSVVQTGRRSGPDVASRMRKVPARPAQAAENRLVARRAQATLPAAAAAAAPAPAVLEPIAPARYKVQLTVGAELHDKLVRLRALMRRQVPDGDLVAVLEAAVTAYLDKLEARRYGKTERPRTTWQQSDTSGRSRHIPAAVKRAVVERDGDRCTFVDDQGRRCSARDDLEFDHVGVPFGRGGDHHPDNVTLRCRGHNVHGADKVYGTAVMDRYRRDQGDGRAGQRPSR